MGFINCINTVARKSNGNIMTFYQKDNNLYLIECEYKSGWNEPKEIINDICDNQFNIQIDKEDNMYGIVSRKNGEVLYFYTNEDDNIEYKKLFEYDSKKYILRYPNIKKLDQNLHIIYYLQDISDRKIWAMFSHYFDGENWIEGNVDFVVSYPVINPFIVSDSEGTLNICYFNIVNGVEEIFTSRFNYSAKSWTKPLQLTNTNNKKIYLNTLQDKMNICHITWSEFVNGNLVVKYTNGYLKEGFINECNVKSLSEQSNCSFPTLIKTGKALWCIWTQMNKLYNCYSFDYGKTWSEPDIDDQSIENDFIRYKFISNNSQDLNNFKLDTTFGTNYPRISFIGFKNLNK
ncbi:hypothetical protein [Tepidibacter hydrothermalis]|uniref:Exo-alpha-sialidase n=1 Tax=Tepidibacter hydrothermalis TaxID=3036126 RepID=A0ABY8EHY0_9FIRM|nr:hypothetical protein [Tepidibacter hydrothermalis]WFD11399.1 hypothetical protein P4S50_04800 [Tepidibacter hydrothermalis]